jgi:probable phosphoglycerate mutase
MPKPSGDAPRGTGPLRRRYHLLRHGQSLANVEGVIVSAPATGTTGYGLTEEGRAGVRDSVAAARAGGLFDDVPEIVASPFLRTVETAALAAELLGCAARTDVRLRERFFGALDGTLDEAYQGVWAADRLDPDHVEWGVESAASVARRMTELIGELEAGAGSGPVLLVTHGDPASILIAALAGGDLRRHRELGALPVAGLRRLG